MSTTEQRRQSAVPNVKRRLTIIVTVGGFTTVREYQNRLGYWTTVSTAHWAEFPWLQVETMAHCRDYAIVIRAIG